MVLLQKPNQDRGLLAIMAKFFIGIAIAVCIIVPNSFQVFTAALLGIAFLFSILTARFDQPTANLLLIFLAGSLVSVVYLFVGYINGAPNDAIILSGAVYIVSPIMWLLIGTSYFQLYGIPNAVKWFTRFTWAALLSIVLFFYAYFTFGRESVQFLAEEANINVTRGFAGATMLVYGSMIFLSGAIFAAPTVLKSKIVRLIMVAAMIAAAATSGRAAFLIAIPIGFAVGALLRPGLSGQFSQNSREGVPLLGVVAILIGLSLGIVILNALFVQLDLMVIAEAFFQKLASGGGTERVGQFYALWAGVEDSYGLGQGHGVGVSYLRSDEHPWRYELLPLATILRVGLFGTAVYALPFLAAFIAILRKFRSNQLSPFDVYMAGGLMAALAATFTNPYMESFIFQFMYFLPVVCICMNTPRLNMPTDVALSSDDA